MDYDLGDDNDETNEYADIADQQEEPEFSQKDVVLFLVDARKEMWQPAADGGNSPLTQALGCVQASMKRRVQSGDSDLVGLLLFGTEHAKAARDQSAFPHMYMHHDLDQPTGQGMRALQALAGVDGKYTCGHMDADDPLGFENVLWMCAMIFNSDARTKNCRRRIYLMTNDPDPSRGNAAARKRVQTRAGDLQQAHVWLEPFFFPPPGGAFDLGPDSFWYWLMSDLRAKYEPQQPEGGAESSAPEEDTSDAWTKSCLCGSESELLDRVSRKQHRKRTLGKVNLILSDTQHVSLNLLRIVAEFKKPATVKVWNKNPELQLKTDSVQLDIEFGSRLSKQDLWRGFDLGGKYVYFGPTELQDANADLCPAGLQLLGFHDRGRLKPYHNCDIAYFAEAAERRREGSAAALEALVGAMVRKEKIGMGTLTQRNKPRLVAMLPQLQQTDERGNITLACGLHLVPLPWKDDLRKLQLPPPLAPDDLSAGQTESATRLVTALTMPQGANPAGSVPHPGRHKHFAYLEALAISTPEEPTVDGTLPDAAWLEGRADEIGTFREAFGIPDASEQVLGGSAPKRQKVEKAAVPESAQDWMQCYRDAQLEKQTMPKLKEFLKAQGLPVGGKKDELVRRAHDKLEEMVKEDANAVKQ